MSTARGRVLSLDHDSRTVTVHTAAGVITRELTSGDIPRPGDFVALDHAGRARVLLSPSAPDPTRTLRRLQDPRRLRGMAVRDSVESGIRDFFRTRGFREVRTPVLVGQNATEPHITPIAAPPRGYLQTSPELPMKRLLVGGLTRIYQLATVFRDEPDSITHRAEFTLLEWYRAFSLLSALMDDVESLIATLAIRLYGDAVLPSGISVEPPWPRLTVRDLFREDAEVDLVHDDLREACARHGLPTDPSDSWDDLYFRLWLGVVEPKLPPVCFVTRYPASQSALAVTSPDPDGSLWTDRFEVYCGGLELGNAFQELTDPAEQRRRFEAAAAASGLPVDEDFLTTLAEGMPPCSGIALGVDRLAMLLAHETDIEYVRWF
jgi:elongation factor P--(R)-beta-lysine ligase